MHADPTFAASRWCNAYADVIAGGLLLEVKTRLGPKSKVGVRRPARHIAARRPYEALGYLLFDTDDRYRIERVGWHSARYGNLVVFDVDELLQRLIGDPYVDHAAARARVHDVLTQT